MWSKNQIRKKKFVFQIFQGSLLRGLNMSFWLQIVLENELYKVLHFFYKNKEFSNIFGLPFGTIKKNIAIL